MQTLHSTKHFEMHHTDKSIIYDSKSFVERNLHLIYNYVGQVQQDTFLVSSVEKP